MADDVKLMPVAGMNNAGEDAALQIGGDSPRLFVRDAVNLDVTPAGRVEMRKGLEVVSLTKFHSVWQSPLHRDVFGVNDGWWGKIDMANWAHTPMVYIGSGEVFHCVIDNRVYFSCDKGIFSFNGEYVQSVAVPTPPAPGISAYGGASIGAGKYGLAIAWVRGSVESALSDIASIDLPDASGIVVTFPLCLDSSVTTVRLYSTRQNGGELQLLQELPVSTVDVSIPLLAEFGRPAMFARMSAMPTGKYLKPWRGRLLVALANVIRFSEAMAYHIHDELHGFVQMPQRVSFLLPVDGGIWVGQTDHVAFLEGATPDQLSVSRKTAKAPIPGSAILVESGDLSGDVSQSGSSTAVWLAENGYVAGTASGQIVEFHRNIMSGISGAKGTSVVFAGRITTAVT